MIIELLSTNVIRHYLLTDKRYYVIRIINLNCVNKWKIMEIIHKGLKAY